MTISAADIVQQEGQRYRRVEALRRAHTCEDSKKCARCKSADIAELQALVCERLSRDIKARAGKV